MKKSLCILAIAAALTACQAPTMMQSVSVPTSVVQNHANYTVTDGYIGADKGLYGKLYRPKNQQGKQPIVILAHGLGADSTMFDPMAKTLVEQGIAVYAIDFKGGGRNSKSKGDITKMTVLTEVDDLTTAINEVKQWNFVDKNKIVVIGASQGALVSALTAAKMPNDIAAVVQIFPGYVIPDFAKQSYPDPTKIPEKTNFMNGLMDLGRDYYLTAYDLKPYEKIANYKKPVLIIHGDKDNIVPIAYGEKAHQVYQAANQNSQFIKIEGFGHSLNQAPYFEQMANHIKTYLKQHGFLK